MLKLLSSYYITIILLIFLILGAGIGTFIENDFGTSVARDYVYDSIWYEVILALSIINLFTILIIKKVYREKLKFLFHISFIIILFGAGVTRYFGYDGVMHIREGESSSLTTSILDNSISKLPFEVKLNRFELERYAGSKSPSSYSSFVTIIDRDVSFEYHIYMNHTLDYRGYRFFQTSYDIDEKGTILSLNRDSGREITYFGYFLLSITLLLNLFNKSSRFQRLHREVSKPISIIILLSIVLNFELKADYISSYLNSYRVDSIDVSKSFGRVVVQARMGRLKPLDTLNKEIVRKLSTKKTLYNMSANQIVLGMLIREDIFKKVPIIYIGNSKIKKLLDIDRELVSFDEFFNQNGYILSSEVQRISRIKPSKRDKYESEVIKVDERLNIAYMVFNGMLLKIFPIDKDNSWLNFQDAWKIDELRGDIQGFIDSGFNRDYQKLEKIIDTIESYQTRFKPNLSQSRIDNEILLNRLDIFENLTIPYLIAGVFSLILAFVSILKNFQPSKNILTSIYLFSYILLLIHSFGLIARWYISGYAPFSNTYESIIYIAYSCSFAGVLIVRKNLFALSSSQLMAGVFMFVAHLGNIDPEITNLVPVLKSFWLTIHVSVITASYGFFAISSLLGAIVLILFIFKESILDIKKQIIKLSNINEMSLILGLTLLVIGNLLGGVWADESWGRYWAWDPKETWSYISILTYTIVIHLRLIKPLFSYYLFNVLSLLAFSSILMTYFGVNFYLAGKHSYATGDPVPIPLWVYILTLFILSLIAISYRYRKI